jgi:pantothenate kinase
MAEGIEAYPWFLNKPIEVTVAGLPTLTRINVYQWVSHWRPLLERLLELHHRHRERVMVAIGGPPASGKSVLAAQIQWMAEKNFLPGCSAVALPMDGFHFTNEYLTRQHRVLPDGTSIPLSEVKGAPDTFDVAGLRQALQLLRQRAAAVPWPGYSRIEHDPIPHAWHVSATVNLVLVEGNYMLLDRGPYAGIPGIFDFRMYLDTPAPAIISNLVERHIAGGKTLEEAKAWIKRIDLPNARLVEATHRNADLIVERNTAEDIVRLDWRPAGQATATPSAPEPPTPDASA